MSEASLQLTIRKGLQRRFKRSFWFKVHGGPYQRAGIPDLLGCVGGFWVAIEVKVGTNKPTVLQRATIQLIKKAGGIAFVATSKEEACRLCLRHLNGKLQQTRVYSSWRNMMARCYDKKHISYKHYGARGISVCKRWQRGVFFMWEDMGFPPDTEEEKYYLDRINNDGNYEPSNCQWLTVADSNLKKRNIRMLTYKGETKPLAHWAEEYGLSKQLLSQRLAKGMSLHRALTRSKK